MVVSVVVPTYNRGAKLRRAVELILESDLTSIDQLEVIVVDDGSKEPAGQFISNIRQRPRTSIQCIRQANAGPAAARNRGTESSRGGIVLFVDDDVFVPPDLVANHARAHAERPGAVIFGRYPFDNPEPPTALHEYFLANGSDPSANSPERYVASPIIASGHISFERSLISSLKNVYRSDLATPVAEEFELSARLAGRNTPIYIAPWIVAIHGQEVELRSIASQQYTHGKGCAEAALKCPETLAVASLGKIIQRNEGVRSGDSFELRVSKSLKSLVSKRIVRETLLNVTLFLQSRISHRGILWRMYRLTLTGYFAAGIRDGLKRFSRNAAAAASHA